MLNNYRTILLLVMSAVVLIWVLLCVFVFGNPGKKNVDGVKIKKKSVFSGMSKSQILSMILAVVALTYLLSSIHARTYTTVILFVTISAVAPYFIINNMKRTKQEKLFRSIVVYCQNTALLLRQTHNAYASLKRVVNDIDDEGLKEDVLAIFEAFSKQRETCLEVMETVEKKYPYTIVRSLDSILFEMYYVDSNINDELLNLYSDDVQELQKAIRKNQTKRMTLRIQYIGINVGCIITYSLFLSSLKNALGNGLDTAFFSVINTGFLTLMVISLFVIDSYFCSHLTTE